MDAQQTMAMVGRYLGELGIPFEGGDGSSYRVLRGSTGVFIATYEYGPKTMLHFRALVLVGVSDQAPISVLAELNGNVPFGKFCYFRNERLVTLEYERIADSIRRDEFELILTAVAAVADGYDEKLKHEYRFGGLRHTEQSFVPPARDA